MTQKLDLTKLLPSSLKNETLESLVSNLFNRFVSEEQSVFVAGEIGKPSGEEGVARIAVADLDRELNALVPAAVVQNGVEKNAFVFSDLLQRLVALGCDVDRLRTWLAEQHFNFAPPIDLDKFVNYQNYYWVGAQFKDGRAQMNWNPEARPEHYVIARPAPAARKKLSVDWAAEPGRTLALWGADRPGTVEVDGSLTGERIRIDFTAFNQFVISGSSDDWKLPENRDVFIVWDRNPTDEDELGNGEIDLPVQLGGTDRYYTIGVDSENTTTVTFNGSPGAQRRFFVMEPSSAGDFDPRPEPLLQFTLITGTTPFAPGDWLEINIIHLTNTIQLQASPSISAPGSGKGYITNVGPRANNTYIDQNIPTGARRAQSGDRVLAWQQADPAENGIYVFRAGRWERAEDADTAEKLAAGAEIFVRRGNINANKVFTLPPNPTLVLDTDPLIFTDGGVVAAHDRPTNDWQEYNFWYHKNDIIESEFISLSSAQQAQRPIVEFNATLQLNKYVDGAGFPAETAGTVSPAYFKTRFNQLPLFDLFRYDGTHAKKVSAIFFFAEDPDFPIDPVLQRRAQVTSNIDFVFGVKILDEAGRLLFFKREGELKTIWEPGAPAAEVGEVTFVGGATGAAVTVVPEPVADSQAWTLVAVDASNFSVTGTRSGSVTGPGNYAQVGVPFSVLEELTLTITSSTPFEPGDTFTFNVRNRAMPRYVKKLEDGSVVTYAGGPAQDRLDNDTQAGIWLTPRRMFENLGRELLPTINYADLAGHLRSIIKWQDGFTGASFGNNNYYKLVPNIGAGGKIREFDSNFPLLLSMLIQPGLSPLGILDFAEQQYRTASAGIEQFVLDNIGRFTHEVAAVPLTSIAPTAPALQKFLNYFKARRAEDVNLRAIYGDSSALVPNWPVTLPMIGLVAPVAPAVAFDNELSLNVLVYHDGHRLPLLLENFSFYRELVRQAWPRSDGSSAPGIFSETVPLPPGTFPYARQLWLKSSTNELFTFNVISDADDAPETATSGDFWYRRSSNQLYAWDDVAEIWVLDGVTPLASLWQPMSVAAIQNSLILAIEQLLFESVHPARQSLPLNYDVVAVANLPTTVDEMKIELARFSAKYGYDTYAPNYVASDAFSWNYSQAIIPGVTPGTARWHEIYLDYFDQPGISLPTSRPDVEPWRLLNYPTKAAADAALFPNTWDGLYAGITRPWSNAMWTAIQTANPGMKLCVNVDTDALLPPYVSLSLPEGSNALLNVIPPGIDEGYQFGDNGPVEMIWRKSLEFAYGAARAAFKVDPLRFLDKTWGETYVRSAPGEIRLERNLVNSLPHVKFQLHGERLHHVVSRDVGEHLSYALLNWTGAGTLELICTFVADDETFFSVVIDGVPTDLVVEGQVFNVTGGNFSIDDLVIDDRGIPFIVGDKFTLTFFNDIPDPNAPPPDPLTLGCEGCVAEGQPTSPVTMIQVNPTFSFTPAQTKQLVGLGQLYTNLLRFNAVDTAMSEAINSFRRWEIKLAHRFGALVRADTLAMKTALGQLPTTSYSVLLKRAENVNSRWISGLRVQLVEMGSRVVNSAGALVPKTDGSDWTFRVEGYNPFNPVIEYYELDPAGDFQTFFALGRQSTPLAWKRFTGRLSLKQEPLPIIVTGVQRVLDLVYGYVDRLEELGFKVNYAERAITDEETGRNLDWQLEVEKFVDRVFSGISAGQGHILNPFYKVIWVETPVGIQARYTEPTFTDAYVLQAAYDAAGETIPIRQLHVIRTDERTATYSNTPIYSAHIFNDEYEHALLLNQRVSDEIDSPAIFIPFLGIAIDSAYLSYTRQLELTRKPTFNGFFLSGSDVRRNIVSGINQIGYYYDAARTFNEPGTARHATALLGFSKKDYFGPINVTNATQFNYWRGLIQAKGTNMTLSAFVNYYKFNDATVDEYWAYKLATYGDARDNELPEIKLSVSDVSQRFTQFQFYSEAGGLDAIELYTPIEQNDDTRWFSIDDLGLGVKFEAASISETVVAPGAGYVRLNNIFHNGDAAAAAVTGGATLVGANLLKVPGAGTYTVTGHTWLNPTKFSPLKLIDYVNSVVIKEIALWHPAIGIHAYEPLQVINIISETDPALYNYSVKQVDNRNYNETRPWAKREVGRVWWDTSNLGYIPYYDALAFPERQERQARWGKLAEWSTIDLYEWVESTVPPSEYDAKAQEEEGRSDLPIQTRASGRAARKQLYSRRRHVQIRPIAWSRATVGSPVSHPSFGPAYLTRVYDTGSALFADTGTTAAINLVAPRRFGGWVPGDVALGIEDKPVGEVIIGTELLNDIGSVTALGSPVINSTVDVQVTLQQLPNAVFGNRLGAITSVTREVGGATYYLRLIDETGFYEDVELVDWEDDVGSQRFLDLREFALRVILTKLTAGALAAADLAVALNGCFADVYLREGVRYEPVIPLPDTSSSNFAYINDPLDPEFTTSEYEWRTWEIPTQAQLSADLAEPRNSWKPYAGDWLDISVTSDIVDDMAAPSSNLLLRSGEIVRKYGITWTDWQLQADIKLEKISNGADQVSFARDEFLSDTDEAIDVNRIQVFVNGVQLNPNPAYGYIIRYDVSLTQQVVQVVNILPEGATVLFIYRAVQPTAQELAFDPEIKEDYRVQVQYREDYQFTALDVRDAVGNITGKIYYFWVTNKTTARQEKNMSIAQAAKMLEIGPSEFALLSRATVTGNGASFDSIAIAGLNRYVTKNDTYKLRFQRNFTLRDDPEQLKLKNVHTEWTLLRRGQLSRIPKKLWDQLTDAVSGQDAGGNPVPSQARIDYDEKYGTRTRFGFEPGQIFADTELLRASITNTILNTKLTIKVGDAQIIDYITAVDFADSGEWFSTPQRARQTMDAIWAQARARQINEIFFEALEDALANNYELTDIFKTSYITVQSSTRIAQMPTGELEDAIF